MMDYENTVIGILQNISLIKKLPHKIKRLIHKTKRVEIICDNKIKSVHNKFNCICMSTSKKIKNKLDVSVDRIQFVKEIGGIDRYLILINNNENAIQNGNEFIKQNRIFLKNITIPSSILTKCIIRNGNTLVNVKDIFMRYAMNKDNPELISGHTIKNILDFNRIEYGNDTILEIKKIVGDNMEEYKSNVFQILEKNILELL